MLQVTIGTGVATDIWKPVLNKLIEQESVYCYKIVRVTPTGRNQTLTVITAEYDEELEAQRIV